MQTQMNLRTHIGACPDHCPLAWQNLCALPTSTNPELHEY